MGIKIDRKLFIENVRFGAASGRRRALALRTVCLLVALLLALSLAACSGGGSEESSDAGAEATAEEPAAAAEDTAAPPVEEPAEEPAPDAGSNFDTGEAIAVVSREDGSGTRGAFIELFGIEEEGDDGSKKDMTTKEAVIAKQTDVMMTNIAGDLYAIGYISLGSVNDTIKPVGIDGVEATTANVENETYPIVRPFNIATKGEPSGLAADFIGYIMSADGQAVIGESYIPVVNDAAAYEASGQSGKIVVAGSSSVTPIMEKLKEAYIALNPDADVEIQMSDSSAGVTAAIDGTCDIAMASRELKDTETELTPTRIALDGIAVIVNNDNPTSNLTKDQVKAIFTGGVTEWSGVAG
ncbi:MAG: substrate-binding domain-containing protein [Clostridiales Family XIII bacterium]|nr:substrate-binding domain-containing protein [Clostridiales Family XIII bacterium]